ncbi:MAG TPA: monofunctional biosynthetic peptidoglycan transglycosylase [Steroidobacteraceae bacterium]|nr:monofunctional biosynthetic peptidoglycan transglycosylase [Steroidobacteraceae bacterium]
MTAKHAGLLRRVGRALLEALLAIAALAVLLVLLLRWINPWTSAFMVNARLAALLAGDHHYQTHYQWVDLEQISPQAALAVIASEDQQFPFHAGFDFRSIREAVRHNAVSRHKRGASTISQQVAKNLFLWSGRSYLRKGLEAGFTLLIELCWPKERILEVYLNIAQFGPDVYGVQAAAQRYYHKDARRLNRADSALLAAVLPNPVRLRVDAPSSYVLSRRDWIAGQMAELGGTSYLNLVEADANR